MWDLLETSQQRPSMCEGASHFAVRRPLAVCGASLRRRRGKAGSRDVAKGDHPPLRVPGASRAWQGRGRGYFGIDQGTTGRQLSSDTRLTAPLCPRGCSRNERERKSDDIASSARSDVPVRLSLPRPLYPGPRTTSRTLRRGVTTFSVAVLAFRLAGRTRAVDTKFPLYARGAKKTP